ncbi:hypothetical protein ABK040_014331 [Willaertia magna]
MVKHQETLDKVWKVIEKAISGTLALTTQQQEELFTLKKQIETQFIKNEQIISVVGNISSGKSSFLNSLCLDSILPTQGSEETKISITIQFLNNINFIFRFIIKNNNIIEKEITARIEEEIDLIYNEINELNNNYNDASEFKNLECTLECCKSDILKYLNFTNVKVFDTPGVNGNYTLLQNITKQIIEYSNAIIVTLNLNELDVKNSLSDLFNLIKPFKDSIIILITKLDSDLKHRNKKQIYKKEIGEEEKKKIEECKEKLMEYYDLDISEERILGYSSEIELDGRTIHFEKLMNCVNKLLIEKNSEKKKNDCIIKLCQKSCQLIDNNLQITIGEYVNVWLNNLTYLKYLDNLNNIYNIYKDKIKEKLKEEITPFFSKFGSIKNKMLDTIQKERRKDGEEEDEKANAFFGVFDLFLQGFTNNYEQDVISNELNDFYCKLIEELKDVLDKELGEVGSFNFEYISHKKRKDCFEVDDQNDWITGFTKTNDRKEELLQLFEEEFNEITKDTKIIFLHCQQQFEKEIFVKENEIKQLLLNIKSINEVLKDLLKNNTEFKIYTCNNFKNQNELTILDPITNVEEKFTKSLLSATGISLLYYLSNEQKQLVLKVALSIDHDEPYHREIEILQILSHPIFKDYYVKIYGEVNEDNSSDKRGLLMQRYKGNAENYFIENKSQKQSYVIDKALKLAIPISVLHRFGIIHRDIKLANYLLDDKNNLYLTDFGYSKDIATGSNSNSTPLGTLGYIAPEFNYNISLCSDKVDVWSLGIVLYEICCGLKFNRAVTNQEEYKTARQEIEFNLKQLKGYHIKFIELILKMIEFDPMKRISIVICYY